MSAPGKPQILLDQVRTRGRLHHMSQRQIRPYSAVQNRAYTSLSKVGTSLSIIVMGQGFSVEAQYITYMLQATSEGWNFTLCGVIVEDPTDTSGDRSWSKTWSTRVESRKKTQRKKTPKKCEMFVMRFNEPKRTGFFFEVRRTLSLMVEVHRTL